MEKHRKPCHHDWDGSGWDSSSDWDGHDFHKKKDDDCDRKRKCCDDWDDDWHRKKKCIDHRRIEKFDHHRFKFDFCCRKPFRKVIHCRCGKCIPVDKKRCCKDWW